MHKRKKALFDKWITSEGKEQQSLTQLTEADIREILVLETKMQPDD